MVRCVGCCLFIVSVFGFSVVMVVGTTSTVRSRASQCAPPRRLVVMIRVRVVVG